MWIWIWFLAIVISLTVEVITFKGIAIWTAFGSLTAFVLTIFALPFYVQLIAFFAVSVLLFFALRKITLKYLNKKE